MLVVFARLSGSCEVGVGRPEPRGVHEKAHALLHGERLPEGERVAIFFRGNGRASPAVIRDGIRGKAEDERMGRKGVKVREKVGEESLLEG